MKWRLVPVSRACCSSCNKNRQLQCESKYHVWHIVLHDGSRFNYNLMPRPHNLVLTVKSLSITDIDFITWIIFNFKDIYWWCYIVLASGYCYCLTLYILFLSHSNYVLILLSCYGLSNWIIDWLIDWLIEWFSLSSFICPSCPEYLSSTRPDSSKDLALYKPLSYLLT